MTDETGLDLPKQIDIPFPAELLSEKPLNPEDTKLLQQQWNIFNSLKNQAVLENPFRKRLTEGKTDLAQGTLIHGTSYDLAKLQKIHSIGILSSDFTGIGEWGETYYCADFFRATNDQSIGDWVAEYSQPRRIGDLTTTVGEPSYLPTPKPRNNRIGFLIDPTHPKLQALLKYDAYDPKMSDRMKSIIDRLPREIDPTQPRNVSAVLVGIPSNFISGVIVGGGITPEQQQEIKRVMGAMVNIYSPQGVRIDNS